MLTKQQIKTIKSHPAYNLNVAREEEANMTLIDNGDDTFTIDDWGVNSSDMYGYFFHGASLERLPLKVALNRIAEANDKAEAHDYFTATWWIKGL